MSARRAELLIGLVFLLFALVALVLWIPLDVESGILEKARRQEKMGDAPFPTAIAEGRCFSTNSRIAAEAVSARFGSKG